MKSARQTAMLDIIQHDQIQTQEELAAELMRRGFRTTQATVSRDIRELRLTKTLTPDGKYCYAPSDRSDQGEPDRSIRLLADLLLSAADSGSLVVLKTLSGSAGTAAEAIDSMPWPEVLGTLAGDNTILLVARTPVEAAAVTARMNQIISGAK